MDSDEISTSERVSEKLRPEEVRRIGIALNGARSYGWRERMVELTGASSYTIRSWAENESSAAHRPCSGPAARLLCILADLHSKNIDVRDYLRSLTIKI